MIDKKDFQIGTVFLYNKRLLVIDEEELEVLMAIRNYEYFEGVEITLNILKDNLGFDIHDMGEFWQCEIDDFVLIQPKMKIVPGVTMPFIFGYKTTVAKAIAFKHVHHLQIVYITLQQKELVWKG